MTWRVWPAQRYVLTLFLTAGISSAISLAIPARRGARSRGVAVVGREAVPPQVSHTCGRGRSTLGSSQLVHLKEPRAKRLPGSSFSTITFEPGGPTHLPR